jgi:hypothetical protein
VLETLRTPREVEQQIALEVQAIGREKEKQRLADRDAEKAAAAAAHDKLARQFVCCCRTDDQRCN